MKIALPDNAGDRGNIDNRPTPRGDDRRRCVLSAKERPGRVDPHQIFPGLYITLILIAATADASIIDQHVQPAIGLDDRGDRRFPFRFFGNVKLAEHRCPAIGLDFRHPLWSLVLQQITDSHLSTFGCKQRGCRRPHTERTAGDQRNFSFETFHHLPLQVAARTPLIQQNLRLSIPPTWRRGDRKQDDRLSPAVGSKTGPSPACSVSR